MKKFEIGKNAMYCNAEAVRNYPEVLRGLPFCNWKLEKDSHGRLTKVRITPKQDSMHPWTNRIHLPTWKRR